ncbi:MAG: hypothetical protein WBX19_10585, partial [Terracidiphilus sp.]
HVQAGVRIVSAFGREWYFDNIRIDNPVAQVLVDKNGVSNLPARAVDENYEYQSAEQNREDNHRRHPLGGHEQRTPQGSIWLRFTGIGVMVRTMEDCHRETPQKA